MDYPARRDFLRELAAACHKTNLGLFVYYSIGIDWHHPYFLPNTLYSPARPHYKQTPAQYRYRSDEDFLHYMNFAKAQITELCSNYGPIAGVWFDTIGGVYQHPDRFRIQEVYDLIHTLQPHALVIFKTDDTILEENVRTLTAVGEWLDKEGFPKPVDADFMRYRTRAQPKLDTEKANQTAR